MNLKKIEIYGFKSFADKLELKFDYGITGIVGPNGCGKSNVADAIRWVLGEQSAKMMRGKGMQDLIFNGTDKRKSMSYCEATLVFDNKNRLFPLDFDEVAISRKLLRSGESEYLINKNKALLKDITNLLRDVGLGREGYSIVGQGRIEAILNSRPEDRRAIFEEALGISKFRAKKVETERKILKTRDNMARLYDILNELNRQLNPLKKQSEDARKFLDIREKLKYHEVNTYIYNYDNASIQKDGIKEKIKSLEDEYEFADLKYAEAFDKYETALNEKTSLDNEYNGLKQKELDLTVGLERQSGESKLIFERIKNLDEQNKRLNSELSNIKNILENAKISFTQLSAEKEDKQSKHALLVRQLSALNDKNLELIEKITQNQDKVESSQTEVLKILDNLADQKSQIASLRSERASALVRLNEIDTDEEDILSKLKDFSTDEHSLAKELSRLKAEKEYLLTELSKANQTYRSLELKLIESNSNFNRTTETIAVDTARLKMLNQMVSNFEGFGSSVKLLLKDCQNNAELNKKVLGVVANIIKVPELFESAIEVSLGNAIQNIVTKDENDTRDIINYLKNNRYGRITFLPLTSIKARKLDDKNVLKETGCYGIAGELISFDERFSNIVNNLLGSTLIVDNIDTAISISKKYDYKYRIVTLDGDMIVPMGSISGGSKKVDNANILSYDREIKEVNAKIEATKVKLLDIDTIRKGIINKKEEVNRLVTMTQNKIQDASILMATIEEKLSKSTLLSINEKDVLEKNKFDKQRISTRINEIDIFLAKYASVVDKFTSEKENVNLDVSQNQGEYQMLKATKDKLSDDITNLKLKIAAIVANIETNGKDIVTVSEKKNDCEKQIVENTKGISDNNYIIKQFENEIRKINESSKDIVELDDIKEKILNMSSKKEMLQKAFIEADKDRSYYTVEIQRLSDLKLKEEFNLSKVDTDIGLLQEKIQTDYELTYSSAMRYKDSDYDINQSKKEITRYRNQINQLGYINVNAINDYEETYIRFNEIQNQLNDLKKADEDLSQIIAELTKEMVIRFNDGFESINNNFSSVFKELFAGGHARLTIEKDENKNELDYGIEIEAQPPGKKLQNISLLSGGERTLTAAAILFAILKLKPMPFCVLDEIEAALDDANAERIAKYLRKFSADTQFIVITHKKPTMEEADVLYGVTMEEKGISKIVSVKLTEAIQSVGA